jgi:hypothetical protein
MSTQPGKNVQDALIIQNRIIIGVLLILAIVATALYFEQKKYKDELLLQNFLSYENKSAKERGKIVKTVDVEPCIMEYTTVMPLHGFDAVAKPGDIIVPGTKKITTSENFRGTELLTFLLNAARARGTDSTEVRVTFGIYTQKYLEIYEPDANLRKEKLGRVAIFLITYKWEDKKWKLKLDGDDEAFDLGGLHP